MSIDSHRDYFRRYKMKVEEYGEILVAEMFGGRKLKIAQSGYDIAVAKEDFVGVLESPGMTRPSGALVATDDEVLIEVKSKQYKGATVVHCNDIKLNGRVSRKGKTEPGMTHLAIVLVDDDGNVVDAWLMDRDKAAALRREGKTKYIPVAEVRKNSLDGKILNIAQLLNSTATERI